MVTTKNLLIIFAVLLLLLTLLSAFGGSIYPVENFDSTNNPITGGNSADPNFLENKVRQEYPSAPMSIGDSMPVGSVGQVGPSASDNLYESPNYGLVEKFEENKYGLVEDDEHFAEQSKKTANATKKLCNGVCKLKPNSPGCAICNPQKFTQYPTATVETFVEPFEDDNGGLKAVYANI
jgi:hypothetical protein